jgi:hypothetical protein
MMTTTYEITGFHKNIERDNWENGCVGDCQSFFIPMHIKADSLAGLKSKILSFVGATDDAMECDSCDEIGRIDIQKTENDYGEDPSSCEESAFKAGEIDLWLACYTCYVELVERETVSAK